MSADAFMHTHVDLGRYRLFVECAGAGAPTIVLEAGSGQSSQTWDPIWETLRALTRVCRYDRAGLGQSTPGPRFTTCQQLAHDLHNVLQTAAIPGPYLLVGHSFGSFIVRVYAHQYPEQVVGLLLIDPSHEATFPRWLAFYEQILNLLPPTTDTETLVLSEMRTFFTQVSQRDPWASMQEGYTFYESAAAVRKAPFGHIPVVVLSSDRPPDVPPGLPQPLYARLAPIQQAMATALHHLHQDLAHQASCGQYHLVRESGHFIHHDQPDAVIDVIRQQVERIRP